MGGVKYLSAYTVYIRASYTALLLTASPLNASEVLSYKELISPSSYEAKNIAKILYTAQNAPELFVKNHKGAPLILHLLGSRAMPTKETQNLVNAILKGSMSISTIKSNDGRSLLHAVALCSAKYKPYIVDMICYLLEKGIDSEMKDNSGCTAEEYLLQKGMKFYMDVKRSVTERQKTSPVEENSDNLSSKSEVLTSASKQKIIEDFIRVFTGAVAKKEGRDRVVNR